MTSVGRDDPARCLAGRPPNVEWSNSENRREGQAPPLRNDRKISRYGGRAATEGRPYGVFRTSFGSGVTGAVSWLWWPSHRPGPKLPCRGGSPDPPANFPQQRLEPERLGAPFWSSCPGRLDFRATAAAARLRGQSSSLPRLTAPQQPPELGPRKFRGSGGGATMGGDAHRSPPPAAFCLLCRRGQRRSPRRAKPCEASRPTGTGGSGTRPYGDPWPFPRHGGRGKPLPYGMKEGRSRNRGRASLGLAPTAFLTALFGSRGTGAVSWLRWPSHRSGPKLPCRGGSPDPPANFLQQRLEPERSGAPFWSSCPGRLDFRATAVAARLRGQPSSLPRLTAPQQPPELGPRKFRGSGGGATMGGDAHRSPPPAAFCLLCRRGQRRSPRRAKPCKVRRAESSRPTDITAHGDGRAGVPPLRHGKKVSQ